MKIFDGFFNEKKDDNFAKAKLGLKNIKSKFDGFVITFPDATPEEIMFIKDRWEDLPKKIGNGVKIMALNFREGFKSLVTSYTPHAYIMPHKHHNEYEVGRIIKGSLIDKFNGTVYNVGDEYRYAPNQTHYLCSTKEGCLVHSILTTKDNCILKPLPKKVLSKLEVA